MRFRLPSDKHDIEVVETVAPDPEGATEALADVLGWMQDANWPVAQALAPLLPSLGDALVPPMLDVIRQRDAAWTLHALSPHLTPTQRDALIPELLRLATKPTPAESAEALPELAQHILSHA